MTTTDAGALEPDWRKSSYSVVNGACFEVAIVSGAVAVTDSAQPGRRMLLRYSAGAWQSFVSDIRDGRFDKSVD